MPTPIATFTASINADTSASANSLAQRDASGNLTNNGLVTGLIQAAVGGYTSAHTVSATETFLNGNATSASFAFTLPPAATYPGRVLVFKKLDSSANTVTITPAGSDTIDGAASKVISSQYGVFRLFSDGTVWWTW